VGEFFILSLIPKIDKQRVLVFKVLFLPINCLNHFIKKKGWGFGLITDVWKWKVIRTEKTDAITGDKSLLLVHTWDLTTLYFTCSALSSQKLKWGHEKSVIWGFLRKSFFVIILKISREQNKFEKERSWWKLKDEFIKQVTHSGDRKKLISRPATKINKVESLFTVKLSGKLFPLSSH